MAGGLIQISVYGSQDIFLTGTPEITFFKSVYRRHTNFSIEALQQELHGTYDFGYSLFNKFDYVGDLLYRTYIEFDIPEVYLKKNETDYSIDAITAQDQFIQSNNLFKKVFNYLQTNYTYLSNLNLLLFTNNISMSDIDAIMNSTGMQTLIDERNALIEYLENNLLQIASLAERRIELIFTINRIDIKIRYDSIVYRIDSDYPDLTLEERNVMKRNGLIKLLHEEIYQEIQDYYEIFMNDRTTKDTINQKFISGTYTEAYKFAWVEELGHILLEEMKMKIGGHVVDCQTGEFLIVWNQVTRDTFQRDSYYHLIGNRPILTTFDTNRKPGLRIIVPFQFWFCRYNGLALPMISLKNSDVTLQIKLRNLRDCCYFEKSELLDGMDEVQALYDIHLRDIFLYADYVYLDTNERRRFAQSSHEYLIEQVQVQTFDETLNSQTSINLTFTNPCKFLLWTVQLNQYLYNPDGTIKTQRNNFAVGDNRTGHTIDNAWIDFYSFPRVRRRDPIYYNYVQPYQHFTHTPNEGVYIYSFSLTPEEHQPSGAANLGRLPGTYLNLIFSDELLDKMNSNVNTDIPTGARISVFTVNYNVLRIFGGMGGVAFQVSA
jgi:hypothetical protein